MTRRPGPLTTALAFLTALASAAAAHASDSATWSRGIGDPRIGAMAAYGPIGWLRAATLSERNEPQTWRVGYRFADKWWAGLQLEAEVSVPGLRLRPEGLATMSGQYDFPAVYGLRPYVGAAATFVAQPTASRLVDSTPIGAWLRLGVDYQLTQGLHSYVEVDGAYLTRGLDGMSDGQARPNVGETTVRDTLQWRTGLMYRF